MIKKDKKYVPVLVVDFGSQTTQLILRRIREIGIYCEVISYHQIIDKIKELKPRTFKFKEDPSRGTFAGLIAQELNEVFPTWVTKTDDGTGDTVPIEKNELDKDEEQPWTIGTDALQFYLVSALKESIAKIETLETKVKALEAK